MNLRNLLVGNGLNCQFDSKSYTAKQIVLRVLKNCNREDFPTDIIVDQPYLLKEYLAHLFSNAREILTGKTDIITVSMEEKKCLAEFIGKYSSDIKHLKMTDICFEDYYLLHDLLCHTTQTTNPDQYNIRQCMRAAYLYAIYNDGALNKLYLNYPQKLIDFLSGFDSIFTTNYDNNLESATGKRVIHLHGQFDCLRDVYDSESLRNQIDDAPIKNFDMNPEYFYLYCNAITTHSGAYKELMIHQNTLANSSIDKWTEKYKTDLAAKQKIDSWLIEKNQLLKNFANAIIVKANHPECCFSDNYHFDLFSNISGDLEILGFSPWNDFHIFKTINDSAVDRCVYYYHTEKRCQKIEELLPNLAVDNRLEFKSVSELWGD